MNRFYFSLDKLIKALNIFASLQGYAIVKRCTKVSKKKAFCKAVLMFDRSKEHIDENEGKKNTTSRKTNCLFDATAILEEEKWSYQLRNNDQNYDPILASAHPAYRKMVKTKDWLDQIANHAKTGTL